MPPQRAAHSEALDFADHPRDLMSPISEQEVITPTPTSYTKSTNLSQRAKRLMINLGRRAYVADETTSTTSNSTPVHTTSTLASSLVPHNFSCPQCLIPDNDPFVHYGGVWFLNVGPQSFTSHSTTTPGSSISLKFNGSGILIFGTVPASNDTVPPPSAVYFLDKNPPFPTTLPRAAMDIPHQPLFATQQHLSDEEHLIIINITKASAPYTLSGFFVFPNMDTKNMEVGQPTTKPFSNTTKSQTSQTPLSSNSSSAAMEQMSSSSGGHHQTSQKSVKILTAALAVIGFLLLVGSVIFFIFRRRTLARLRQVVRVSCPEAKKARPGELGLLGSVFH
ncbi:hypothetical protein CPB84DRAFT_289634 [Gymnopilus junonius]|uniref:Uncharacterized protein n=1 Tax=Gymnopilus junonius TaxID=109634 RepID=A0A9P5ND25_GYMJU|nr:hypothetical protein CPB84DRAFT_289634 [Gymnopilus junonius]